MTSTRKVRHACVVTPPRLRGVVALPTRIIHPSIHPPAGVIPLDGVELEAFRGTGKRESCFKVTHPSLADITVVLCAGDDEERERWMDAIAAAASM